MASPKGNEDAVVRMRRVVKAAMHAWDTAERAESEASAVVFADASGKLFQQAVALAAVVQAEALLRIAAAMEEEVRHGR